MTSDVMAQNDEDLESKPKGKHIQEILKFEKFFKVKWDRRQIWRVVRDANVTFKQKKEAHKRKILASL